jgi:hypothetical protein
MSGEEVVIWSGSWSMGCDFAAYSHLSRLRAQRRQEGFVSSHYNQSESASSLFNKLEERLTLTLLLLHSKHPFRDL